MIALPKKLRTLTDALLDNGWSFKVQHGTDTGENPFISVEAVRGYDIPQKVSVTWHTRATAGKSYRLFDAMVNERGWHDATLTQVMAEVES